jgi:hypothetical protein
MLRRQRFLLALAIAPLAPVLLYYFLVLPRLIVLILGAPLAYGVEVLFGLPIFLWARHFNRLDRTVCASGGFLAGAIVAIGFAILNLVGPGTAGSISVSLQLGLGSGLVFGLCGAIAGWTFAILAGIPKTAD